MRDVLAPQPPTKKPKQPQRPRHVPQRTCIVCRQVRPKRELIRVVRTPDWPYRTRPNW